MCDIPPANLCPPGEIGSELIISHHLVIGKIRRIRDYFLVFILKILHHHSLPIENSGISLLHLPVKKSAAAKIQIPMLSRDITHTMKELPNLIFRTLFHTLRLRYPVRCGQLSACLLFPDGNRIIFYLTVDIFTQNRLFRRIDWNRRL